MCDMPDVHRDRGGVTCSRCGTDSCKLTSLVSEIPEVSVQAILPIIMQHMNIYTFQCCY